MTRILFLISPFILCLSSGFAMEGVRSGGCSPFDPTTAADSVWKEFQEAGYTKLINSYKDKLECSQGYEPQVSLGGVHNCTQVVAGTNYWFEYDIVYLSCLCTDRSQADPEIEREYKLVSKCSASYYTNIEVGRNRDYNGGTLNGPYCDSDPRRSNCCSEN